jgi:hypothetical protein
LSSSCGLSSPSSATSSSSYFYLFSSPLLHQILFTPPLFFLWYPLNNNAVCVWGALCRCSCPHPLLLILFHLPLPPHPTPSCFLSTCFLISLHSQTLRFNWSRSSGSLLGPSISSTLLFPFFFTLYFILLPYLFFIVPPLSFIRFKVLRFRV